MLAKPVKKPPAKRSSSPGGGRSHKRKEKAPLTPIASADPVVPMPEGEAVPVAVTVVTVASSDPASPAPSESAIETKVQYVFKDPNFVHSTKAAGSKKIRIWKNLKQICASERGLPWADHDVTYSGIDAPPSFTPAKKYSDITGLPAKYTDPQTKIRYASTEEFQRIRMLPSDLVTGYLTLRKASVAVP